MRKVSTTLPDDLADRVDALNIATCESRSSKLRSVVALGVVVAENNSNHHGLG